MRADEGIAAYGDGVLAAAEAFGDMLSRGVFRQDEARVEYGATRTVDGWRWNRHRDRWKQAPPPRLPDRNQTGVYRRTVTVPANWAGSRVVLGIEGNFFYKERDKESAKRKNGEDTHREPTKTVKDKEVEPAKGGSEDLKRLGMS